jgi:S-DNA-T family DNA segregation ATPase FtsK/SpoIIIE
MGAEQLLGMGDMLYMANGGKVTRVHGPFVSDAEVEEIVSHLKKQGIPEYREEILDSKSIENTDSFYVPSTTSDNSDEEDLLEDALEIVRRDRKCSTSYIQRKLSIGYNRAAKIVEALEEKGFVSPANHVGKRDILIPENNT